MIYEQTLDGDVRPKEYAYTTPFTNMSRVLGQGVIDAEDGLKFDEKDYDSIQQILRTYSECKSTHSQIILGELAKHPQSIRKTCILHPRGIF